MTPLRRMGADIVGRQDGNYAPLGIGAASLRGMEYQMPVASAQVKSCLLLAGLYAQGLTVLRQPGPARDHTERMLAAMGAPMEVFGNTVHSERPDVAAIAASRSTCRATSPRRRFCIVAASIVPDSRITITGVGVNPTRTGIVEALLEMGAHIALSQSNASSPASRSPTSKCAAPNCTAPTFGGDRSSP